MKNSLIAILTLISVASVNAQEIVAPVIEVVAVVAEVVLLVAV